MGLTVYRRVTLESLSERYFQRAVSDSAVSDSAVSDSAVSDSALSILI